MTNRMTNEEAIKIVKDSNPNNICARTGIEEIFDKREEAFNKAIKAIEKIGHLIDRPCEACEYHKENGCSKWGCVFEEVK